MKIVLTGASGAIGKELIRQCPHLITPIKVRANDVSELSVLEDGDTLIHAAALVHSEDFEALFSANVELPMRILENVSKSGKNIKVLLVGSMSILGSSGSIQSPADMSKYAYSKYMMEALSGRYENTQVVRFSTIFYRDPTKDGLSKVIHTAKHAGKVRVSMCERDFIPLSKACYALLALCRPPYSTMICPGPITIASGKSTKLWNLARHLQQKFGFELERSLEASNRVCSHFAASEFYGLPSQYMNIYQEAEDYFINA